MAELSHCDNNFMPVERLFAEENAQIATSRTSNKQLPNKQTFFTIYFKNMASSVHSLSTVNLSCSISFTCTVQILYRLAFVQWDTPALSWWSGQIHAHTVLLNDLLLSVASLVPGLYLNSTCTLICIQFVRCDIIRNADVFLVLFSGWIWKLNGRDVI